MNILELSEQEIVRRQSLEQMRQMGIDPYPAAEFPVTGYTDEIKETFTDIIIWRTCLYKRYERVFCRHRQRKCKYER